MNELLLEIWTSVRRNKLRTFLTGFSVAWGIFMLVILLGSGNGLKNGVLSNLGNYAINSIDLYGGRTSKPWKGYEKGQKYSVKYFQYEYINTSKKSLTMVNRLRCRELCMVQYMKRNICIILDKQTERKKKHDYLTRCLKSI